jgi:hypothetical protein
MGSSAGAVLDLDLCFFSKQVGDKWSSAVNDKNAISTTFWTTIICHE